jgi:hypothetical protein
LFWAMTQCIMYRRRWHVRAILWRAVWEIDELAKDCSREVTEERTNQRRSIGVEAKEP